MNVLDIAMKLLDLLGKIPGVRRKRNNPLKPYLDKKKENK